MFVAFCVLLLVGFCSKTKQITRRIKDYENGWQYFVVHDHSSRLSTVKGQTIDRENDK